MTSLPDRPNTALLVIDAQNEVPDRAHDRDGVVARINELIDRALGGRAGDLSAPPLRAPVRRSVRWGGNWHCPTDGFTDD